MLAHGREDDLADVLGVAVRVSAAAEQNEFAVFPRCQPKADVKVHFGERQRAELERVM